MPELDINKLANTVLDQSMQITDLRDRIANLEAENRALQDHVHEADTAGEPAAAAEGTAGQAGEGKTG